MFLELVGEAPALTRLVFADFSRPLANLLFEGLSSSLSCAQPFLNLLA